jgi:hypothetical protein
MALLDTLTRFDADVVRNITSLRHSQNLFDDLVEDAEAQSAAVLAEMAVRPAGRGVIQRGLAYSEAVLYPFTADSIVGSRFADGTTRAWYGALDEATALAETCYHALQQVIGIEGVNQPVVRHRCVYLVHAAGLFVDVRAKLDAHPELVADDYTATQAIGHYLVRQGQAGLLYPSARWRDGDCLVAFREDPLGNARVSHYLTYRIDPVANQVTVERQPGVVQTVLTEAQLRR